jgi:WD40 repeat protein
VNLPPGTSIAFHPDGSLLATTGWDLVTRLWNWRSGEKLLQIANSAPIIQFSQDGRHLGPYHINNKVGVWEVHAAPEHRALVRELAMGKGDYGYPAVSHDSRLLFVALLEGRVHTEHGGIAIWDLDTGRELSFLPGFGFGGGGVAADARDAMFVGFGGGVYHMPLQNDVKSPNIVRLGPPEKLTLPHGRLTATRDGKFLGVGLNNSATILFRNGSDRLVKLAIPKSTGLFWCVAGTSDGQWVVSGGTAAIVWRREGDNYV